MTTAEKIKLIRESLGFKRDEFSVKSGIPIGTLIGVEQGRHEPKAGILIAIAKLWPEYAAFLLTDETEVKQRNPEIEAVARELINQKKAI